MKICIPTEDNRGLEGMVCGHFGSAPFFTLVDTDSGSCEIIGNSASEHGHGGCGELLRQTLARPVRSYHWGRGEWGLTTGW